jgi:hypothetical protein
VLLTFDFSPAVHNACITFRYYIFEVLIVGRIPYLPHMASAHRGRAIRCNAADTRNHRTQAIGRVSAAITYATGFKLAMCIFYERW